MTLTTEAWFARLARVDGGRGDQLHPASHRAAPDLTIIPDPERPRRRPHTCGAYRVKVPVEAFQEHDKCRDLRRGVGGFYRASPTYLGCPAHSKATVGPAPRVMP